MAFALVGCPDPEPEVTPDIAVPESVDFGAPFVGTTVSKTVTISNNGTASLNVTSLTITGNADGAFAVVPPGSMPAVVLPNASLNVEVTLSPKSHAAPNGTLVVASNDPDSASKNVALNVTWTDQAAAELCSMIGVDLSSGCDTSTLEDGGTVPRMAFGAVAQGTSAVKYIALSNSGGGNVPVTVSAISFAIPDGGPPNPANFVAETFKIGADGTSLEAVELPAYLNPVNGSVPATQFRAKVTFTANEPTGAVPPLDVRVALAHPTQELSIPVTATVGACPAGTADCNGDPLDGCEVNTNTDEQNCGVCDRVCGLANTTSSTCNSGTCAIACTSGFGNCDGAPANGCEANLTNDIDHCGSCTIACNRTNGNATCASGVCGIVCFTTHLNCNNDLADGCEINRMTDEYNCSTCGNNCNNAAVNPHPNATDVGCANAACTVVACAAGYTDMNKVFSDGCECQDETTSYTSCSAAVGSAPVQIPLNTTGVSVTGKVTPVTDQDWVFLYFLSEVTCTEFAPRITITGDASLRFDVQSAGCANNIVCAAGDGIPYASGVRSWESSYNSCTYAYAPAGFPYYLKPASHTGTTGIGNRFAVRVYTTASTTTTCLPYTLTITN